MPNDNNRLKPTKPWTKRTRMATSKKPLSASPDRSRRKTPPKLRSRRRSTAKNRSRASEVVAPRSEIKDRLRAVVRKIVTFGIKFCPTCKNLRRGDGWNLTCSHVFPCRIDATGFDIHLGGNCVAQCLKCNVDHSQKDSEPLLIWFAKQFGAEKLDILKVRWNQADQTDVLELEAKLTLYLRVLELMTAGRMTLKDLVVVDYDRGIVALPEGLE